MSDFEAAFELVLAAHEKRLERARQERHDKPIVRRPTVYMRMYQREDGEWFSR